jgi:hypothetical protein
MSEIGRKIFVILVWALTLMFLVDYLQDQKATRDLKDGLELATHDATMMLDSESLSLGTVVFDRLLAEQVFALSFSKNLKVELIGSEYQDTQGKSFFKYPIRIVHMEFIDDITNPGITYPCTYGVSCGEAVYDIFETVKGPAIVVVAETYSPRGFSEELKPIRQAVVYEYGSFN